VILIRHAQTEPGVGDPPGFRHGDCATQRNLSDAGRAQAKRLGELFVKHQVPVRDVLSSRWCRCVDTARLAFGEATPWQPLDSFFEDRGREPAQTRAVLARLAKAPRRANLVLVTHNVNIAALTGASAAQGEMVVAKMDDGQLRTIGTVAVP
jgi:broad specificity phosphatase PhoE